MHRYVMSNVVLCVFAVASLAADLKITGEMKVASYKLVELSATGMDAEAALLWDVYPEELADIREVNGKLYFVAPPGVYKVKLRTVKGKVVDTARAVVTISGVSPTPVPPGPVPPGPTPVPIPPTPTPVPDGRLGLVKASRDGFKLVTSTTRVTDAAKLATAQRSHSTAIVAGGLNPDTPANYLAQWRVINRDTGIDTNAWIQWGNAVSAKIKVLNETGVLKTRADWAEAFNEIAEGLGG